MRKPVPLAFGPVAILHAIADGNRFGFDIMDATGLTSGTVSSALLRLEMRRLVKQLPGKVFVRTS